MGIVKRIGHALDVTQPKRPARNRNDNFVRLIGIFCIREAGQFDVVS